MSPDTPCDQPRQAIILAAGRGSRLAPYTDTLPTALISIAKQAIVARTIEALRGQGVDSFLLCRGWQGSAFNEHMDELGPGVRLVDCPRFASTGMLESLRVAAEHLAPGGFYLVYGDIVFRTSVARRLRESAADHSIVVDATTPGSQSKGFQAVEAVASLGEGIARIVRRVGKNRCVREEETHGEFAGLVKFSDKGRETLDRAMARLWETRSSTGESSANSLPWWLEPLEQASICDLLQYLVDEGAAVLPVTIFGGWHEVNTPQDLTRACNDTALFLSEVERREQVASMGACLLSEANDLKRPLYIVAQELNVSQEKLECLLKGDLELSDALEVLRKMSEVYPVPLNDLWLDADDTTNGVRVFTHEAAEASARILDRPDRTGSRTPYYEYRDAAMSRCCQFRPEWIKQLRLVQSGDAQDPDVQMNNGHLMMQTTLFVGPVDFYYRDRHGVVHRQEMQTGDSNFISPFVPHSFTTRDPEREALIIAVTYGGRVRRAFTEFTRVGASRVLSLAGDKRDPKFTRRCVLQRHMDAECMTCESLASAVPNILPERLSELLEGAESKGEELEMLAGALNVRPSDLLTCPMEEHEEVVITRTAWSHAHARNFTTYSLAPLARTRHQPDLKTFDLLVLEAAWPGEELSCGLHTFVYHFGSTPVWLSWEHRGRSSGSWLRPGDSACMLPLVRHRFSCSPPGEPAGKKPPSASAEEVQDGAGRRLLLVRIPGHLTGETLEEFATFSAHGRERVGAETQRWYN